MTTATSFEVGDRVIVTGDTDDNHGLVHGGEAIVLASYGAGYFLVEGESSERWGDGVPQGRTIPQVISVGDLQPVG